MLCKSCGIELKENEAFCHACGAAAGDQNTAKSTTGANVQNNVPPATPNGAYQPQYAAQGSALLIAIKTFFSPNMTKGLGTVVSTNTYEGVILILANVLAFGISIISVLADLIKSVMGIVSGMAFNVLGSPKAILFSALFVPVSGGILLTVALAMLGIFLLGKIVKIKNMSFVSAINAVGYSYIPMIVALLANIIIGLIIPVICIVVFLIAYIMHLFLLYMAIQRIGKPEGSLIIWFSVIMAVVFCLGAYFIGSFSVSSIVSSVGSIAELFG